MNKIWVFIKKLLIIIGFFIIIGITEGLLIIWLNDQNLRIFLSELIGFLLVIIFFGQKLKFQKIKNFWKYFGVFVLCYIVSEVITIIISTTFNVGSTNEEIVEAFILAKPLLAFFAIGIFAPFYEETLFRLNFQNVFKKKWTAIIVTGIIFGSLHLLNATSAPELLFIIPYSIMGIGLSYAFFDSENIYTSISLHSINNIFILLLLLIGR